MALNAFDLDAFISTRRGRWDALSRLLEELEEGGVLTRDTILELVRLYRLVASDLNQARSATANPELLDHLNQLTGRAYRIVYQHAAVPARPRAVRRFLTSGAPGALAAAHRPLLAAGSALLCGALLGVAAALADPANVAFLVPSQFYAADPAARVAEIEDHPERIDALREAAGFGTMLFTHNIQVSFLAFSLAALTLVGGWLFLFWNGVILGAVAGQYLLGGVATFFLAWVGPHGALELPAIVLAGTAGLHLGRAFWLPGGVGRAAALRAAFPVAWRVLLTAALVLVAAGLIEGSFSQFSAKTVPYSLKIGTAAVLFACLCLWLLRPVREEP